MLESAAYALDEPLDLQRAAWARGERPTPEAFLPDVSQTDRDALLIDLIYNEVVLREEQGELPDVEEYVARYPGLAADLRIQFEVHSALSERNAASTLRLSDSEPDSQRPPSLASGHHTPASGYEILHSLGEGGMGTVFKARDRALNRLVALKMIHPGRVPSSRDLRRFRTEAEAIARLRHPNIVRIHEVGEIDGTPYLSLELAEGGTLAARLKDFPYSPRAAAELVRVLALAIHHAHEHNIVHRDLKPANILFGEDGEPRIADFGLAKIVEEGGSERDTTRTGEPLGTPRYMSPEQAAGRTGIIGVPADVHALGLLLYECLTGQVPFVGSNAIQTMQRIRDEEPLPPRMLQAAVPKDLETICLHCLRKEPERRYGSAKAMADDLGRFLRGEPIDARPTPAWEKAVKWCRRNRAATAGIACGLVLLFGAGVYAQVRSELEARRVAQRRDDILRIVDEGHSALARKDSRTAQARFLDAWNIARSEPALDYLATNVFGWLDHARREDDKRTADMRADPRSYDDIRFEAFLLALLAEKGDAAARKDAFEHARSLTVEGDPAWDLDRELAAALEAEACLACGAPADGVAALERIPEGKTRLWRGKRAACLEALGRTAEAAKERGLAESLPPLPAWDAIDRGMVLYHKGDSRAAATAFEEILATDAANFPARLFQSVCFLRLGRAAEAKVGLTACLAQRPYFAWSYKLRGDAYRLAGEEAAAKADYAKPLGMKTSPALKRLLVEIPPTTGDALKSVECTERDRE